MKFQKVAASLKLAASEDSPDLLLALDSQRAIDLLPWAQWFCWNLCLGYACKSTVCETWHFKTGSSGTKIQ